MFVLKKIIRIVKLMVAAFFVVTILSVLLYRYIPVYFTSLMFIRAVEQISDGSEIKMKHCWIPLDEIPVDMVKAVIGSEDAHFLEHHGFDFDAIQKAVEYNKKSTKRVHGGSTITQQTAKNVFLWPSRSWIRKGLEAYYTVLIELFWSKQRIIEVYLNSIEMGDGIYGIKAVAKNHFNCQPSDLSRSQCALVAVSLPNPRKFKSNSPSSYMRKRQQRILREMRLVKIDKAWYDD